MISPFNMVDGSGARLQPFSHAAQPRQGFARNRGTLNKTSLVIMLVLIGNAQIFSATSSNPFGINGAQEAFYVFLGLWAFKSIAQKTVNSGKVPRRSIHIYDASCFDGLRCRGSLN